MNAVKTSDGPVSIHENVCEGAGRNKNRYHGPFYP